MSTISYKDSDGEWKRITIGGSSEGGGASIEYLTQEEYDYMLEYGELNVDKFYCTPDLGTEDDDPLLVTLTENVNNLDSSLKETATTLSNSINTVSGDVVSLSMTVNSIPSIYSSTSSPTSSDGKNGDLWIVYKE